MKKVNRNTKKKSPISKQNPVKYTYLGFIGFLNLSLIYSFIKLLVYYPGWSEKSFIAVVWGYLFIKQVKETKFKTKLTFSIYFLIFALLIKAVAIITDLNFIHWTAGATSLYSFLFYFYGKKQANQFLPILILMIYLGELNSPTARGLVDINLRLLVSKVSGWLLPLLGVAVKVKGNLLYTIKGLFVIDTACSGINNLMSLTFLGFVWAHFRRLEWLKVACVGVLSMGMAIVANVLRVVSLTVIAYYANYSLVDSGKFSHSVIGIIWFLVALAGTIYVIDKYLGDK